MKHFWLWVCVFLAKGLFAQTDTIQARLQNLQGVEKAKYLQQAANTYLHISPQKAHEFASQALEIAQKEKVDTLVVISNLQIASVDFQEGNYDQALALYLDILKFSQKINYNKGIGNAYNNIGNIFFLKKDNDQAFRYYTLSLEQEQKIGYQLGIGESYENLGLVLTNQKKYSESLEHFEKALQIYQKLGKKDYLPQLYNNIGVAYRAKKEYAKALDFFEKALEANKELGLQESVAYNWQNIGSIYLENQEFAKAIESFEKSNQTGKDFKDILKDNYEYLAQTYSLQGDYKKAYAFQQKFTQLKDSLFSRESDTKIAELEAKFQNTQKQQQIEILQKNSSIQALEISQKNTIIYTVLIISVLTIGLALLFYNRSQIKHKSNLLLMNANEQIRQSVKEKEVLLQEVHHRVKNNLQLVSSLLAWQSEFVQDEKMHQLIEENISRIQSMALIHENLYRSPSLSQVAVNEYLQHLISHLQKSFDHKNQIEVDAQIAPALLNAEQIIPIGLIVNELISNAYKYAFANLPTGKIAITFDKQASNYYLKVLDTGQGLPADYQEKLKKSLGLQLVQTLVRQLKGKLEIQTQNPTIFEITF